MFLKALKQLLRLFVFYLYIYVISAISYSKFLNIYFINLMYIFPQNLYCLPDKVKNSNNQNNIKYMATPLAIDTNPDQNTVISDGNRDITESNKQHIPGISIVEAQTYHGNLKNDFNIVSNIECTNQIISQPPEYSSKNFDYQFVIEDQEQNKYKEEQLKGVQNIFDDINQEYNSINVEIAVNNHLNGYNEPNLGSSQNINNFDCTLHDLGQISLIENELIEFSHKFFDSSKEEYNKKPCLIDKQAKDPNILCDGDLSIQPYPNIASSQTHNDILDDNLHVLDLNISNSFKEFSEYRTNELYPDNPPRLAESSRLIITNRQWNTKIQEQDSPENFDSVYSKTHDVEKDKSEIDEDTIQMVEEIFYNNINKPNVSIKPECEINVEFIQYFAKGIREESKNDIINNPYANNNDFSGRDEKMKLNQGVDTNTYENSIGQQNQIQCIKRKIGSSLLAEKDEDSKMKKELKYSTERKMDCNDLLWQNPLLQNLFSDIQPAYSNTEITPSTIWKSNSSSSSNSDYKEKFFTVESKSLKKYESNWDAKDQVEKLTNEGGSIASSIIGENIIHSNSYPEENNLPEVHLGKSSANTGDELPFKTGTCVTILSSDSLYENYNIFMEIESILEDVHRFRYAFVQLCSLKYRFFEVKEDCCKSSISLTFIKNILLELRTELLLFEKFYHGLYKECINNSKNKEIFQNNVFRLCKLHYYWSVRQNYQKLKVFFVGFLESHKKIQEKIFTTVKQLHMKENFGIITEASYKIYFYFYNAYIEPTFEFTNSDKKDNKTQTSIRFSAHFFLNFFQKDNKIQIDKTIFTYTNERSYIVTNIFSIMFDSRVDGLITFLSRELEQKHTMLENNMAHQTICFIESKTRNETQNCPLFNCLRANKNMAYISNHEDYESVLNVLKKHKII